MMIVLIAIGGFLLVACWSALGCYALRDFSYSRLEEICNQRGRSQRFSEILRQQESALLGLELLLSLSTLCVAASVGLGIGWPRAQEAALTQSFPWDFVAEYVFLVLAVLLVADILPWCIARVASEPFLDRWWPVINSVQYLLWPLLSLAKWLDRMAHRLVGRGEPEEDDASVLSDEIRTVVDEGQREGYLEQGARVMIHRVMELQDEDVGGIMTPRTDMFSIPLGASLEEARQKLISSGHSRVPVVADSPDEIVGLLYSKDLLKALDPACARDSLPKLSEILREPKYIPETTGIAALLEMMQREHFQLAIVLDEYGGVAGLVTMEDILEEIVGEIADEYDTLEGESPVKKIAPNIVEIDARMHIDDLNEQFLYGLPEDGEFDTIGGFVFSQLGRMPSTGEIFDWNNLKMTIIEADKRKILRLRIEQPSEVTTESSTSDS
ncbi:CBS domain containing protein [Planctopirus limnophila DSM 3776]|uniref:CBS domain containing protein n=1 Tax=Planctopirus limnophila (strain ATCC 43296 / DSM 3776 / IFAM 1008 / Mu 290) TaxID=521674 RepID=D5SNE7_PLAL2|nr:hemolysin family protein [Planctopirus limnophila]ADG68061.1 CBS domain containing protein [Planctopirus limnophila DSM 3776]